MTFSIRTITLFLLLLIILPNTDGLYGQNSFISDIGRIPEPSFSGLKQTFTQMNPFTGVNSISIPLYELKEGDLTLPITLDYSSGGVLVNDEPGIVGLSWNLNAGGMISRKVNNIPDESCGGILVGPNVNMGYYTDAYGDVEAITEISTYSSYEAGYFFTTINPPGTTMGVGKDQNPDEFFFNFNGMSGSFFMGHDGEWKIKTESGVSLKVTSTFGSLPDLFVTVKEFQIKDQNGITYTFGGDETSIEREWGVVGYSSFLMSYATYMSDYNNRGITGLPSARETIESFPITWRIKKIQSPNGATIKFNYVQPGQRGVTSISYVKNIYSNSYVNETPTYKYVDQIFSGSVTKPSILTSIETDNELITFTKSVSNGYYQRYNPELNPTGNNINGYYKLDSIEVFGKEPYQILKKIKLNYIEAPTERLKMNKVAIEVNEQTNENFTFTYNPLLLQNYGSNTDHWGFNNTKARNPVYLETQYFNSKETDLDVAQAEVLTSVKTQFGGLISYFYESNSYFKVAKQNPFIIDNYSGFGGGIRIRKIVNDPIVGGPIEREFFYINSGFSEQGITSGVLSGIPKYSFIEGANAISFQSKMVNTPSRTMGRDVTYTRVVEKDLSGYKVYTYSNLDNGYMDLDGGWNGNYTGLNLFYPYSSKELLRGKLLKLEYYTSDLIPKLTYQRENFYNEDYNLYVPAIGYGPNQGLASVTPSPISSFVNYIFTPHVKRTIETTFTNAGQVVNDNTYSYNSNNLISTESSVNSDNRIKQINYRYPINMVESGRDLSQVYASMVLNNIISPVIERIETLGGQQIYLARTNYDKFNSNGLHLPKSLDFEIGNTQLLLKKVFNRYDLYGNLLEERSNLDIYKTYLWSYKHKYPIAEIINANYSTIENILGGTAAVNTFSNSNPSNAEIKVKIDLLRNSALLKDAQIKSFTYKPFVGISSITDERGEVHSYEYDYFLRLSVIKDKHGNIIKNYSYKYKQPY